MNNLTFSYICPVRHKEVELIFSDIDSHCTYIAKSKRSRAAPDWIAIKDSWICPECKKLHSLTSRIQSLHKTYFDPEAERVVEDLADGGNSHSTTAKKSIAEHDFIEEAMIQEKERIMAGKKKVRMCEKCGVNPLRSDNKSGTCVVCKGGKLKGPKELKFEVNMPGSAPEQLQYPGSKSFKAQLTDMIRKEIQSQLTNLLK